MKPGGIHVRTAAGSNVNGFFTVEFTKNKLVVVEVAVMTKVDFGTFGGTLEKPILRRSPHHQILLKGPTKMTKGRTDLNCVRHHHVQFDWFRFF